MICNVLCNGSAAADINPTHFSRLPENVVLFKHIANLTDIFSTRIVCRILTATTCVLCHYNAAVDDSRISLFKYLSVAGIKSCINVSRKTHRVISANISVAAESASDLVNKLSKESALHTGNAVASCLFLICKNTDNSILIGRIIKHSCKCRICTNLIVVTVSAHKASVKTDIYSLTCRNCTKLSCNKVRLYDTVLLVEHSHKVKLDSLTLSNLAVFLVGLATDNDIEDLAAECLSERCL